MQDTILTALSERILVIDGAMGTQLQERHLTADDFGGPEYEVGAARQERPADGGYRGESQGGRGVRGKAETMKNAVEKLFHLLKPEQVGVQLTEGDMMDPEASVSALVFHHPEGRYFDVSR